MAGSFLPFSFQPRPVGHGRHPAIFSRGGLQPGFVKQESVGLQEFLSTQWGGRIYASDELGETAPALIQY